MPLIGADEPLIASLIRCSETHLSCLYTQWAISSWTVWARAEAAAAAAAAAAVVVEAVVEAVEAVVVAPSWASQWSLLVQSIFTLGTRDARTRASHPLEPPSRRPAPHASAQHGARLPHRCVIHLSPSFSFHNRTAASLHLGVLRRAPETALSTTPAERRLMAPSTAPGTASLFSLERAARETEFEQRDEGFPWLRSFSR